MDLSLAGDRVGFIGPGDPACIDIERVLVMMDYLPPAQGDNASYDQWDLIVLHHPPVQEPDIPCYVIHSNWDIVRGGACDALADCLDVAADSVLDEKSGLGRVGMLRNGPVRLSRFVYEMMNRLRIDNLRIVNYRPDLIIGRVGFVSGFGLTPDLVQAAHEQGVDLYLSGDLTHKGAILGKHLGLVLVDAPHHATELPGLYRLGELLQSLGVHVQVRDRGIPWKTCFLNRDS